MSDESQPLPDGWRWATLADLAEVAGGLAKGKKRNSKARLRSVPYLRVANVQRGHIDLTEVKSIEATDQEVEDLRLQPGDVLLNEGGDRDKLGRGWVWKGQLPECIHQNHVFRARVRAGAILPELLSHYANSEGQRYFTAQGKQTTNLASISLGRLRGLPVPVPPPAQQANLLLTIDAHFSRLDAATATLERVQRNLERYRASVLKAAVEGRLVPTEAELAKKEGRNYEPASVLLKRILAERRRRWEEAELTKLKAKGKPPTDDRWKDRYEEPVEPVIDGLPELPVGWCWASPAQLASPEPYSLGIGPFGSNLKVSDYRDSGVPLIFVRNIRAESFEGPHNRFVSPAKATDLLPHAVQPGDLLVTKMGDPPGDSSIYPLNAAPAILTADCIKWRIARQSQTLAFFLSALRSSLVRGQILAITKGVAQKKISLERFSSVAIPLPPASEQARIAEACDAAMSSVATAAADAARASVRTSRLRQAILKWAFDGRLVDREPRTDAAQTAEKNPATMRRSASTEPSARR